MPDWNQDELDLGQHRCIPEPGRNCGRVVLGLPTLPGRKPELGSNSALLPGTGKMIARADLAICILTVAILVVGCAKQKSITRAKGQWLGPIAQSESKGLSFAGIKPGEAWSDVQARIEPTCRIVKRNANRYSVICPSWSFEVQTKTEQRIPMIHCHILR